MKKPDSMEVVDGRLDIVVMGVTVHYRREELVKWIAKLEADVEKWKGRLAFLDSKLKGKK